MQPNLDRGLDASRELYKNARGLLQGSDQVRVSCCCDGEGMPAARQAAAARAAAPAPAPALATAAVQDSMIYKLLMQFSSPKGISCDIAKSMWPRVEGLPDRVKGKIEQWQNRAQGTLKISWIEADGSEKYDVDALVHLLEHDFQLLKGPRGEALL